MNEALTAWVSAELDQRNWSHAQLATTAEVSRALVSRTLRGDMPPSCDFCIKIAIALEVPPEQVLRLAGILPPEAPATPEDNPTLQQLVELARTLSTEKQEQLLDYTRFLSGQK